MTSLLIAEELFLLTHDDESGKASMTALASDNAYAGALLLDLAERGAVRLEGDHVMVTGDATGDALLDDVRETLSGDEPRSVSAWISRLPGRLKHLRDRVGESLVRRGVLEEQRGKVLGMFPTTRWPERDPEPERAVRAGLHDVLVRGVTPTAHQAMLVVLVQTQALVPKLVAKDERRTAAATAERLAADAKAGRLFSASVTEAINDIQSAVLLACLTPTIVASTVNH